MNKNRDSVFLRIHQCSTIIYFYDSYVPLELPEDQSPYSSSHIQMKRPYPAERSRLQHQRSSRTFRFGDFRPGCLIFWLIVFTFASTASIYADSSAPVDDHPRDEVTFGGQTLQGRIHRLRPEWYRVRTDPCKGKAHHSV